MKKVVQAKILSSKVLIQKVKIKGIWNDDHLKQKRTKGEVCGGEESYFDQVPILTDD